MELDAHVLKWSPAGMRSGVGLGEFIEKREVERLLSEAFEHGRQYGIAQEREEHRLALDEATGRLRPPQAE